MNIYGTNGSELGGGGGERSERKDKDRVKTGGERKERW